MPALQDLTLMSESGLAFVGVGREVGLAPLASSWLAWFAAAAAEVDGGGDGLASLLTLLTLASTSLMTSLH